MKQSWSFSKIICVVFNYMYTGVPVGGSVSVTACAFRGQKRASGCSRAGVAGLKS